MRPANFLCQFLLWFDTGVPQRLFGKLDPGPPPPASLPLSLSLPSPVSVCDKAHLCEGQKTNCGQLCLLPLWVFWGIELWSLGLAASTFTHQAISLPLRCTLESYGEAGPWRWVVETVQCWVLTCRLCFLVNHHVCVLPGSGCRRLSHPFSQCPLPLHCSHDEWGISETTVQMEPFLHTLRCLSLKTVLTRLLFIFGSM